MKASAAIGGVTMLAGCSSILEGGSATGTPTTSDEDAGSGGQLPEVEMTFAHAGPPVIQTSAQRGAVSFKEYMERESDGRFTVEISPAGQLGGFRELIEQTIDGTIEMSVSPDLHLGPFYPNWNVFSIPYVFPDVNVARFIFENEFGQDLAEGFREETGLRALALWENGGSHGFSTGGPELRSVDDFSGLTFRTGEFAAHRSLVESLGASAEPMGFTELYQALDQGVVDGQKNSIAITVLGRLYEVQEFFLYDEHQLSISMNFVNDEWFQDLHPTYQTLVEKAGLKARNDIHKINNLYQRHGVDFLEQQGLEVVIPDESFLSSLQDATIEPVTEDIRDSLDDPELLDEFQNEIQAAKEDLGYWF